MADDRKPHQIIADLAGDYARRPDEEVLAALAAVPPLADEADPCWADDGYWTGSRSRTWPSGTWPPSGGCGPPSRSSLTGPASATPARSCGTCATRSRLSSRRTGRAAACVAALGSPRPGTRLWAAHALGRLRDPAAVLALERAARDEVAEVRAWAAAALARTPA